VLLGIKAGGNGAQKAEENFIKQGESEKVSVWCGILQKV